MKKVCDYIDIDFHENLLKSTFGGLKYWGNTINLQRNIFEEKEYTSFKKANNTDLSILRILNKNLIEEFYIRYSFKVGLRDFDSDLLSGTGLSCFEHGCLGALS